VRIKDGERAWRLICGLGIVYWKWFFAVNMEQGVSNMLAFMAVFLLRLMK